MSGVEVAGIVLGSIPLIIAALEHYRQGKGHASSFRKYGPHLNILISRLQKQKTLFYLYTVILMRDAGVPYFTTSADPEYEDCAKILLEPQTQVSLKQYLGITYSAFEAVIKDFEQSLKSIVEGLGRIRRDPQAAKNDLKAVLQVNPAQNGKHAFREKIRFTIHRESLELLVNNLTEENLTLKNVVEGVRTLVREEPVAASRSSHKLAAAYKRVQRHAQALYRAVSSVWIRSCHEKHKVLLHLDNLVPKKSFNPLLPQEEIIENVQFKMFFNEYGHSISPKLWHEASIQPIEAEDPSDAWSPNSMLSKPVPRVKVSFMDKPKQYRYQCSNRITDICSKGAQASFSKQILLLDLVQDNFYEPASFAVPQAQLEKRLTCPETVTLDEYLAACINDEDKRMTPKHQTLLALTIAASILQLQCTAWLPRAWTRTAIHFFTASDSIHGVLLEQPVIAHTISHTNNNPTSTANSSFILDPQVVFCELAILLLEIWHHISLETWKMRKDQTLTDSIEGRRCAAERWMRMSSNRLPLYYAKAIEECLVFCTRRTRSWDQDDFQSDICENVIKPLQECCRALVYV